MFKDYDKAKRLLKGSFEQILGLMDKREVSYDEIKELMVESLYQLSKEDVKVVEKTFTAPQVLYAPPRVQEVEKITVTTPQMLYAPPKMEKVEMKAMLSDDFIPGTNVRKPRAKNPGESEAEYLEYLENYYGSYFPDGKGPRARK